jgi:hypothetical protein
VHETDTKQLSIRDVSDNIRFAIVPDAVTPQIQTGQPLVPFSNDTWDLSNGNFESFHRLFLVAATGSSASFTATIILDSASVSVLTLNSGAADTILTMQAKSLTWNNSFITPTTRFLLNVISLAGAPNAATVGVPHVFVSSVGTGTCQLSTANIGTVSTTSAVVVGIVIFP